MSALLSPVTIGNLKLENRFVSSATYEGMAKESGEVSEELIKRYVKLAQGGVGLMVTGLMHIEAAGRGYKNQTGIHADNMLPGLKRLTEAVHQEGGKIVFQLAHCGRQTTKAVAGQTPLAPSSRGRDPVNFVKPREMTAAEISSTIAAFGEAAKRAVIAGADGIQIHAAHGYLVSEFISPYFNVRTDDWGGSDEKRFRFLIKNFRPDKVKALSLTGEKRRMADERQPTD